MSVVTLTCHSLLIPVDGVEASGSLGRLHNVARAATAEGLTSTFGVGATSHQENTRLIVLSIVFILWAGASEAQTYATPGSRARGFARLLQHKFLVPMKYRKIPFEGWAKTVVFKVVSCAECNHSLCHFRVKLKSKWQAGNMSSHSCLRLLSGRSCPATSFSEASVQRPT